MSHLKSCHCCGLIQWAPDLPDVICARCETALASWLSGFSGNRLAKAFALAGLILYFPAMLLPFLRIEQLGQAHESSLLVGVRTLFVEGQALVGVIVLLFSIVLPVFKLGALLFLGQSRWQLAHRHRALTYRIVERLGRWGMMDVLLVAVMVAFVKLGGLVEFAAGPGLLLFALFVLLSLCASAFFDPFCLWDEGQSASDSSVQAAQGQEPSSRSTEHASTDAGENSESSSDQQNSDSPSGNDSSAFLKSLPAATAPPAQPRKGRSPHWVWIVPGAAVALAMWVAWSAIAHRGREISITVTDGHGIKAGDELRYRGIVAGDVENVALSEELERVTIRVRLTPQSDHLARDGSRFWIVRPQAGISGVTGLETVVGSKYLTVIPGSADATPQSAFVGLEEPPLPDLEFSGGIDVALQSQQAPGLRPGLGVFYRNVRIGGILETGLAADGSAVETRAYIRPEYRGLICRETKFWNAGGVHLSGGLTHLTLHVGTLETIVHGGISIAVPPAAGPEMESGARFDLHDQPENDWLDWEPSMENKLLPIPAVLPKLQQATLSWTEDGYVWNQSRTKTGWVLPIGNALLGPRDLLGAPEETVEGSARLQLAGRSIPMNGDVQSIGSQVVMRTVADADRSHSTPRRRAISAPEDGFLITGGDQSPMLMAAARYEPGPDNGWVIEDSVPVTKSHHGGVIVATKDGSVIGCVVFVDNQAHIYPVEEP